MPTTIEYPPESIIPHHIHAIVFIYTERTGFATVKYKRNMLTEL